MGTDILIVRDLQLPTKPFFYLIWIFLVEEFRALKTQQFDEVSLFKVFDADGDGLISKREVREVYRKLGETISEEVLNEMLEEVDSNQDGQISFEEFIAFRDKFPSKF